VSTYRPTQHEDAALDTAAIAIRIMEAVLKLVEEQPALAGVYWELFGVFSDVLAAELAPHAFKLAWALFSTEAIQRRARSNG